MSVRFFFITERIMYEKLFIFGVDFLLLLFNFKIETRNFEQKTKKITLE